MSVEETLNQLAEMSRRRLRLEKNVDLMGLHPDKVINARNEAAGEAKG